MTSKGAFQPKALYDPMFFLYLLKMSWWVSLWWNFIALCLTSRTRCMPLEIFLNLWYVAAASARFSMSWLYYYLPFLWCWKCFQSWIPKSSLVSNRAEILVWPESNESLGNTSTHRPGLDSLVLSKYFSPELTPGKPLEGSKPQKIF